MSVEAIKAKAKAAANSQPVQAVKNLALDIGKSILDNKIAEKTSKLTSKIDKVTDLTNKLDKYGVEMFNPTETMNSMTDSILDEQKAKLDFREKLGEFRLDAEKAAAASDNKILKKYTTGLCNRAQDGFATAIIDGVVKTMTPSDIKNPLDGGEGAEGDNEGGEGGAGEDAPKKSLFDLGAEVFNCTKNIVTDAAVGALNDVANVEGAANAANKAISDKLDSGYGLAPTNLDSAESKQASSLADKIAEATTAGVASLLAPVEKDPESGNSPGFLSKLQTAATAMSDSLTSQAGQAEGAMKADTSGAVVEQATTNAIAKMASSLVNLAKEPSLTNLTNTMAKGYNDTIAGIGNTSQALLNTMGNEQAGGGDKSPIEPYSTNSLAAAIMDSVFNGAAEKGDTEAVAKAVVEEKIRFCSGCGCCCKAAKTCSQTPADVINLTVAAEALDMDLNTVAMNDMKTPDKVSNIVEDPIAKALSDRDETEDFAGLDMEAYDLTEFKALIANGTMLAKVLLGEDEFKRCMTLMQAQEMTMSTTLVA